MIKTKISTFEIVLFIVGIAAAILGFQLINQAYISEKGITSMTTIAIFNWLMLIVLFVLLSVIVDNSKKQLAKTEIMVYLLNRIKGKKL